MSELTLYPQSGEWAMMKEQAKILVSSGMLPYAIKTPQAAIAIMLKGRELEMPPMMAFNHIHIIQGKPTLSAESMLAMIYQKYPKTTVQYLKNDDEACEIAVTKNGVENKFRFSFEDAKAAKLTGKENWSKYRRAMLRSRCISEMARSLFPEALMGCSYTPEEMEAEIVEEPVKQVEKPPAPIEEPKNAPYDPENPKHKSKLMEAFRAHNLEDVDLMRRLAKLAAKNEVTVDKLPDFVYEELEGKPDGEEQQADTETVRPSSD